MDLIIRAEGPRFSVVFTSEMWRVYRGMPKADRATLHVAATKLAQEGRIRSSERFKKLEGTDHLWELKKFQHRFIGFFTDDRRFVVAAYQRKKGGNIRPAVIRTAEDVRAKLAETTRKAKKEARR